MTEDGKTRIYRVMYDRHGDPYRVFRVVHAHHGRYIGSILRALRAERGVGRPPVHQQEEPAPLTLLDAIRSSISTGLSQRATAAFIGISLGKLQRTLKAA